MPCLPKLKETSESLVFTESCPSPFTHISDITPFPTLYSACRRFLTFLSQEAMEITLYYLISMALTQSEKEYSDF